MNPLKNYIFYSICERSHEYFKKVSLWQTFRNFSANVKNELFRWKDAAVPEKPSENTRDLIAYLVSYLRKLYGIDTDEAMNYVIEYFMGQHYELFEESVRIMDTYFPLSIS